MKKRSILLFISLSLFSCGSKVPKDIQEFLSHAILLHEEDVKSGDFSQHYYEKINDVITGTNDITFTFYQRDGKDFGFNAEYTYTGNQIVEGVESKIIKLHYEKDNEYQFDKIVNGEPDTSKTIDYGEAHGYYYKIFDSGYNVYRAGGLFYGDIMSVNANRFYPYYALNEDKTKLTFTEKDAEYTSGLLVDQTIVIDQNGMLLQQVEHAHSKTTSDFGHLVQIGSYEYKN